MATETTTAGVVHHFTTTTGGCKLTAITTGTLLDPTDNSGRMNDTQYVSNNARVVAPDLDAAFDALVRKVNPAATGTTAISVGINVDEDPKSYVATTFRIPRKNITAIEGASRQRRELLGIIQAPKPTIMPTPAFMYAGMRTSLVHTMPGMPPPDPKYSVFGAKMRKNIDSVMGAAFSSLTKLASDVSTPADYTFLAVGCPMGFIHLAEFVFGAVRHYIDNGGASVADGVDRMQSALTTLHAAYVDAEATADGAAKMDTDPAIARVELGAKYTDLLSAWAALQTLDMWEAGAKAARPLIDRSGVVGTAFAAGTQWAPNGVMNPVRLGYPDPMDDVEVEDPDADSPVTKLAPTVSSLLHSELEGAALFQPTRQNTPFGVHFLTAERLARSAGSDTPVQHPVTAVAEVAMALSVGNNLLNGLRELEPHMVNLAQAHPAAVADGGDEDAPTTNGNGKKATVGGVDGTDGTDGTDDSDDSEDDEPPPPPPPPANEEPKPAPKKKAAPKPVASEPEPEPKPAPAPKKKASPKKPAKKKAAPKPVASEPESEPESEPAPKKKAAPKKPTKKKAAPKPVESESESEPETGTENAPALKTKAAPAAKKKAASKPAESEPESKPAPAPKKKAAPKKAAKPGGGARVLAEASPEREPQPVVASDPRDVVNATPYALDGYASGDATWWFGNDLDTAGMSTTRPDLGAAFLSSVDTALSAHYGGMEEDATIAAPAPVPPAGDVSRSVDRAWVAWDAIPLSCTGLKVVVDGAKKMFATIAKGMAPKLLMLYNNAAAASSASTDAAVMVVAIRHTAAHVSGVRNTAKGVGIATGHSSQVRSFVRESGLELGRLKAAIPTWGVSAGVAALDDDDAGAGAGAGATAEAAHQAGMEAVEAYLAAFPIADDQHMKTMLEDIRNGFVPDMTTDSVVMVIRDALAARVVHSIVAKKTDIVVARAVSTVLGGSAPPMMTAEPDSDDSDDSDAEEEKVAVCEKALFKKQKVIVKLLAKFTTAVLEACGKVDAGGGSGRKSRKTSAYTVSSLRTIAKASTRAGIAAAQRAVDKGAVEPGGVVFNTLLSSLAGGGRKPSASKSFFNPKPKRRMLSVDGDDAAAGSDDGDVAAVKTAFKQGKGKKRKAGEKYEEVTHLDSVIMGAGMNKLGTRVNLAAMLTGHTATDPETAAAAGLVTCDFLGDGKDGRTSVPTAIKLVFDKVRRPGSATGSVTDFWAERRRYILSAVADARGKLTPWIGAPVALFMYTAELCTQLETSAMKAAVKLRLGKSRLRLQAAEGARTAQVTIIEDILALLLPPASVMSQEEAMWVLGLAGIVMVRKEPTPTTECSLLKLMYTPNGNGRAHNEKHRSRAPSYNLLWFLGQAVNLALYKLTSLMATGYKAVDGMGEAAEVCKYLSDLKRSQRFAAVFLTSMAPLAAGKLEETSVDGGTVHMDAVLGGTAQRSTSMFVLGATSQTLASDMKYVVENPGLLSMMLMPRPQYTHNSLGKKQTHSLVTALATAHRKKDDDVDLTKKCLEASAHKTEETKSLVRSAINVPNMRKLSAMVEGMGGTLWPTDMPAIGGAGPTKASKLITVSAKTVQQHIKSDEDAVVPRTVLDTTSVDFLSSAMRPWSAETGNRGAAAIKWGSRMEAEMRKAKAKAKAEARAEGKGRGKRGKAAKPAASKPKGKRVRLAEPGSEEEVELSDAADEADEADEADSNEDSNEEDDGTAQEVRARRKHSGSHHSRVPHLTQTPKKTAPKKTAPKKTAPKKTAPKKTAPKKTAPKKTAPKKGGIKPVTAQCM